MRYFKLERNSDRFEEIGCFPQIEEMHSLGDPQALEGVFAALKSDSYAGSWKVPEPILEEKAISTSLIEGGYISPLLFLTLQTTFVDFLKNFQLGDFSTWPISVHHKNNIRNDYLLFHLSKPSEADYVDYTKSSFFVGKQPFYKDQTIGTNVQISNYSEFLNLQEVIREEDETLMMQCSKLVLDFRDASEDLIRFAELPQAGYYVSEKLRDAIIENRFTGMDFLEIGTYRDSLQAIFKRTNGH